jgi:hypothetical protein
MTNYFITTKDFITYDETKPIRAKGQKSRFS